MKQIDTKLRILWLSDMHYKASYKLNKNEILKNVISEFLIYVASLTDKIDYILLSGDIAQSGNKEDYDAFIFDILTPLQQLLPDSKLIVVPGNHDLFRDNVTFNEAFINSLPNNRLEFFKNRKPEFEGIFYPFTQSFINNNKLPPVSNSEIYRTKLLYGHVIDFSKKTIFVILNSAWYSITEGFLGDYLAKFLLQSESSTHKSKGQIIKDISAISSEYGFQLLGLNQIEEIEQTLKIIQMYSDFVVVTIMHHPINWLGWPERVTNDSNKFHSLRKQTDLLITGHEHVPKDHQSEYIDNNNLLHIQAGCFLNYVENDLDFKIKDNWFSTLELNIKKRSVTQIKHYVDPKSCKWFAAASNSSFALNKRYSSKLSIERKLLILNYVSESKSMLDMVCKIVPERAPSLKSLKNDFFICDQNIIHRIVLTDNIDKDVQTLKDAIDETNANMVCFYFVDLFNNLHEKYFTNEDKLLTLEKIKIDYDFKFNKFRHLLFSKLSQDEALKFSQLKLTCQVKPYWELEI